MDYIPYYQMLLARLTKNGKLKSNLMIPVGVKPWLPWLWRLAGWLWLE